MGGEAFARPAATPIDRDVQGALPMLEATFRAVVRALRARMVTRTGRDLPVTLVDLHVATVLDVLEGDLAADSAVWCPFHFGRADLAGFVVMDARLLSRLVGRLFGDGDFASASDVDRALSEVELSVGSRMCRELFASLERLWPPPHPPRIFAGELSAARHGIADLPVTTSVVVAEVRFGADDAPLGTLQCVLPAAGLKGIAGKRPQAAARPEASRILNFERLMPVEVDLVVELARLELTFSILEGLQVGSELPLGATREVCARVNDRASYYGEAGVAGGVRSFKIARRAAGASTAATKDR